MIELREVKSVAAQDGPDPIRFRVGEHLVAGGQHEDVDWPFHSRGVDNSVWRDPVDSDADQFYVAAVEHRKIVAAEGASRAPCPEAGTKLGSDLAVADFVAQPQHVGQ